HGRVCLTTVRGVPRDGGGMPPYVPERVGAPDQACAEAQGSSTSADSPRAMATHANRILTRRFGRVRGMESISFGVRFARRAGAEGHLRSRAHSPSDAYATSINTSCYRAEYNPLSAKSQLAILQPYVNSSS